MPIVATDLKIWTGASMPEDDTAVSGGVIQDDAAAAGGFVPEFVDISAADTVEVVSDGADTRTITIYGRLASGSIDSEALVLNGTTQVNGAKTYERILKCVLSAKDAARTVTVRKAADNVTIFTLGPNTKEGRRLLYNAASAAAQKIRYELVYFKNHHATLALQSASLKLTSDPAARIKIGVAAAKGDLGTVATRLTAPGGITFVDDNVAASVPTGTLGAGEKIGVWVQQDLPASDGPQKAAWTIELSGNTT